MAMQEKYKIPYTIDPKFGDYKTSLKMEDGRGIDHEFTVRGLLTCIVSASIYGYLVFNSSYSTFFSEGGLVGNILFALGYAGSIYFSLRQISIPGLYGYNSLAPLVRYLQRLHNNVIRTNSFDKYEPASKFVGMVEPDDQGRLRFRDGSYGKLYQIVGTASNNTFSSDRQRAIEDFENFLRTLPHNTTYVFITNTAGQNVDRQINHLLDRLDTETDLNMQDYIAGEIRELADYVRKIFVSLHQYMIIKGDDPTALSNAIKMTRSFIDQEPSVISEAKIPTADAEADFYAKLYAGLTSHTNTRLATFQKKDHFRKSEMASAGSRKTSTMHKQPNKNLHRKMRVKVDTH